MALQSNGLGSETSLWWGCEGLTALVVATAAENIFLQQSGDVWQVAADLMDDGSAS